MEERSKSSKSLENSKNNCLNPVIDEEQILRVGGRWRHSICPYEMKHPIKLQPKSRLS